MKKFVSAFLALALVLSLGITASASSPTGTVSGVAVSKDWSDAAVTNEISFQVVYKNKAKTVELGDGAYPKETLEFSIAADGTLPSQVMPQIGSPANQHVIDANADLVTVTIPDYHVPGKYNYTITQKTGKTLGVGYDTTPIKVQVVVKNNEPGAEPAMLKFVSFTAQPAGPKVNGLVNTYDASSANENVFSLQKKVAGNMGANGVAFQVHVTLTNDTGKNILTDVNVPVLGTLQWESDTLEFDVELTSGSGSPTVISGIPAEVKYTVKEAALHTAQVSEPADINNPLKGYTASYAFGDQTSAESASGTIADSTADAVVITNTKNNEDGVAPETGVYLEALPYVILLAVAVIGLVLFLGKRRTNREY